MHKVPVNLPVPGKVIDTLIAEGGTAFLDYINRLGLVQEKGMIVVSFRQHFFFDAEE